ncbi:unnamed protein product [Pipistrellus nathusii]|uniref:Uncharacterized protein n=1 Tax=Pipistrellus nathusii TaxID=59473 RepID=A0ABN9ZQF2_PIPNA
MHAGRSREDAPARTRRPGRNGPAARPAPRTCFCACGAEAHGAASEGDTGPRFEGAHFPEAARALGTHCHVRGIKCGGQTPAAFFPAEAPACGRDGSPGTRGGELCAEGFLSPGKFLLLIFNKYFPTEQVSGRGGWR